MSVAIPIPLLQHLPDVNVTLGVGVDEYALVYDHGTARFVLRATTGYDHGLLNAGSLGDDDHTQYALLAGRAGGTTLYGGTAANDDLTLSGTSDATRTTSYVLLQPTAGFVGIGTTAPGASLDVYSASRTTIKLGGTGNNYAYADFTFYTPNTLLATKAHLWSINFRQDDYFGGGIGALNFNSNISNGAGGTTGFRAPLMLKENGDVILAGASNVISNGNVGIGTASPATALHVAGAATVTGGIRPAADSTTALQLQTAAGTSVLNVDTTNARVGIGTASPESKLEVHAADGGILVSAIEVWSTDGFAINKGGGIGFRGKYGSGDGAMLYGVIQGAKENVTDGNLAGCLRFATSGPASNPTEWVRITSTGCVGIGDTAPAEALDVTGNINTTGVVKVDDVQVLSNRVIDARCADVANSGDATTDGLIDALRDAMVAHGLIAAAA